MVTTRSLRAEKRTAARALGGSVLTNKVRFTRLETSEQQPTPVLRELMYTKNRLQHQVENLQDLGITQAATIKDLTDEIENYKTLLLSWEKTVEPENCSLRGRACAQDFAKKDEDIATLRSVIQNLTRDNDELNKQNKLIGSAYEDIANEQKKLFHAVNTAGKVLAMASRAQNIVM